MYILAKRVHKIAISCTRLYSICDSSEMLCTVTTICLFRLSAYRFVLCVYRFVVLFMLQKYPSLYNFVTIHDVHHALSYCKQMIQPAQRCWLYLFFSLQLYVLIISEIFLFQSKKKYMCIYEISILIFIFVLF